MEKQSLKHKDSGRSHFHLREIILGGQDGLVNVLGVVLAVAAATKESKIIIIAGIAATVAESISMGAVAFTSSKAVDDHYRRELKREEYELENVPNEERKEIEEIYKAKGFEGQLLNKVVEKITSNRKIWLDTMMSDELHMYKEKSGPMSNAIWVFLSSAVGSLIPLIPFFIFFPREAVIWSLMISSGVLFAAGFYKAKLTVGSPLKEGIELMLIGILAALAGYVIGALLGSSIH